MPSTCHDQGKWIALNRWSRSFTCSSLATDYVQMTHHGDHRLLFSYLNWPLHMIFPRKMKYMYWSYWQSCFLLNMACFPILGLVLFIPSACLLPTLFPLQILLLSNLPHHFQSLTLVLFCVYLCIWVCGGVFHQMCVLSSVLHDDGNMPFPTALRERIIPCSYLYSNFPGSAVGKE